MLKPYAYDFPRNWPHAPAPSRNKPHLRRWWGLWECQGRGVAAYGNTADEAFGHWAAWFRGRK